MKLALVQFNSCWEDRVTNLKRASGFIREAALRRCAAVVFPEMFNSGFSMNVNEVAEDPDGPTSSFLSTAAVEHNINIIAGFALREAAGQRAKNVATVFGRSGAVLARYAKIHPFSVVQEEQHYAAGDRKVVFPLDGMLSSLFICYDLRFPEIFRKVAREVRAIFIIANWPRARGDHWEALLRARAIENQCFIVGVNRIGTDGNGIEYGGGSRVYGPDGREVAAGAGQEFLEADIDGDEVERVRAEFPALQDMKFLDPRRRP